MTVRIPIYPRNASTETTLALFTHAHHDCDARHPRVVDRLDRANIDRGSTTDRAIDSIEASVDARAHPPCARVG